MLELGPEGATLSVDGVGDWVNGVGWSLILFFWRGSSGSELSNDAKLDVLRGSAGGPVVKDTAGLTTEGAGDGAGTDPGRYTGCSSLFGGDGTWDLKGGCMVTAGDGMGPGEPKMFRNIAGPARG